MKDARCGRVEPAWVKLGEARFQGHAEPKPIVTIEYRQCTHDGTRIKRGDFVGFLCERHANEPLRT